MAVPDDQCKRMGPILRRVREERRKEAKERDRRKIDELTAECEKLRIEVQDARIAMTKNELDIDTLTTENQKLKGFVECLQQMTKIFHIKCDECDKMFPLPECPSKAYMTSDPVLSHVIVKNDLLETFRQITTEGMACIDRELLTACAAPAGVAVKSVITLMQDMQKEVEAEGEKEKELFDKSMCYELDHETMELDDDASMECTTNFKMASVNKRGMSVKKKKARPKGSR